MSGAIVNSDDVDDDATHVTHPTGHRPSHASFVVRNLGIYMDADVSMRSHVSKTVVACFAILR